MPPNTDRRSEAFAHFDRLLEQLRQNMARFHAAAERDPVLAAAVQDQALAEEWAKLRQLNVVETMGMGAQFASESLVDPNLPDTIRRVNRSEG